ncbi:ATP-binding protein [Pseudanabaena sp. FACHB-2040]|uniref:ATP-binding protein n=1 Tax=Pseudanabaena sp. FACHB-2040 TaxID=2692859 RepID=UPI001684C284|nr:ATP-binding protein [Pseudanabaena sp. FACHB-2040]MBD2258928.1 histidine kinase [Pseudanabaena sp. FACHB-2040]
MQSYRYEADSLRRIIQGSSANPDVIQIKPKGFKAILQLTADFLETYQVSGTVLAKFPKGALWQEDIQRYYQAMDGRSRLYSFSRTSEAAVPYGTALLPLDGPQIWRGEYFLIILSQTFCGLLVVHRLQSASAVHASPTEDNLERSDPALDLPEGSFPNNSLYLEVCCSVNPELIDALTTSVRAVVERSAQQHPDNTAIQDLLEHWEQYCPPSTEGPTGTALLDRWLGWQLRQQEHLRQSIAAYRKQALAASNLSSQNEVLLNTLRLKDDFLNTIGQELRTPLSTIKTALTLLNSPSLKAPQRQRYMDMITQECDRQSSLISGVLDLLQMETSLEHVRPQALRLADTVPPIVSTYQPLAEERGILLAYTISNDLPAVACPEAWLRQIMIHLLNNSIKFTQAGGRVWVTACQQEEFAELEIRDTGVGIAASELPNLFEHFYRGRNIPPGVPEGAGLGLSIVQQLLSYCGGSILVQSQPGNGSSFRVRLPLHQS